MLKILPDWWIGLGQLRFSDSEQVQARGPSWRSGTPENSDPLPQSGIPPQQPAASAAKCPRLPGKNVSASRAFGKVLEGAGLCRQLCLGPHAGSWKELVFTVGLFPEARDGGQWDFKGQVCHPSPVVAQNGKAELEKVGHMPRFSSEGGSRRMASQPSREGQSSHCLLVSLPDKVTIPDDLPS